MAELENVLGAEHLSLTEARAARLEEALRPTFQALPRSSEDLLEPTAVRYLLHRLFVDRHGWYVVGFDTEGESWNSSSPSSVFATHADGQVQDLFEGRMGERGLSLREVALLGATLEGLVHAETMQRLHAAYDVLGLSRAAEEHATESQAAHALDTYMLMYVMGVDHHLATAEKVEAYRASIQEFYPTWNATKKWVHEVRKEVLSSTPEDRTSFAATTRVVEEVADRYGRWQDQECVELKGSLLKLERAGTGRVPLGSFYQAALDGQWQFSESKAYLKQLGALDETDPQRPSIMIPNYVNAPTNCVAASKFYSVCCISECEALLGHLEKQIAAPAAPVSRIIEVVELLPSATVEAPRTLPAPLLERLEEIAAQHGGLVPFHGRLFNQWLHHAYPRECPYPHLSGTSNPVTPDKFVAETGLSDWADQETMRWHIEESGKGRENEEIFEEDLPWAAEEELFIGQGSVSKQRGEVVATSSSFARGLVLCFMACSVAATLVRMLSQAKEAVSTTKTEKVYV